VGLWRVFHFFAFAVVMDFDANTVNESFFLDPQAPVQAASDDPFGMDSFPSPAPVAAGDPSDSPFESFGAPTPQAAVSSSFIDEPVSQHETVFREEVSLSSFSAAQEDSPLT
jgi:hypothetical protein